MIRVAILDMYEGVENQGMRCLREILNQFAELNNIEIQRDEFEVRLQEHLPGLDYDIYISSGGPGSPLDSEGTSWEKKYFHFIRSVEKFNTSPANIIKKQIFFICHSFQLACRYFDVALVSKRKSTAFGVFPIHAMQNASDEIIFEGLKEPFYAVDSRDYQITAPNHNTIQTMGGSILALEKARPHVPLERAIMAIRFNENMIGTQFHPEADAQGMLLHLQTDAKKQTVVENHGLEKWKSMIEQLNDPDKIMHTYAHILPNFLSMAVNKMELQVV
ncbi:MAG: GMP synthase [Ferruginibacter sp.]